MRVLVFGGRSYANRTLVYETLDGLEGVSTLIHGDATGADTLGKEWAESRGGVEILAFPADWKNLEVPNARIKRGYYGLYNANAGFNRNQRMLTEGKPDLAVAFPGGAGTRDMINRVLKTGVKLIKIKEDNDKGVV